MLKITFIFIILGTCLIFVPHALAGLDDGLEAYYPFNGNAIDETGNGYDGAVNGAALTDDRFGNPSSAYSFDGYTTYINIGTTLNFPCGNNYAVSVWFLNNGGVPPRRGYGQKIMSKADFFNDFHLSVYSSWHTPPSEGQIYWQQYQGHGPGPKGIVDQSHNYNDYQWHHLVVSKVGSYGEMWVDGELKGTVNTLTTVCNSRPLYIGFTAHTDWYQTNEGHWNGKIDDIRIYNRALSESEIELLYLGFVQVSIDIKPGSYPNSINPHSKGKIPVAILSSTDFDAPTEVDTESLTFGPIGDEESLAFCNHSPADVNNDGYDDVVCHFDVQMTGFECGDEEGFLIGETVDGIPIEGSDSVRIVPSACR